ncbi:hypothetical protein FRB95_008431 [Tulasnella sp. JGI-2019a]|nr:hypothetical protein FRB95_008431 [Tulasnella sp. JGI-2019a]
MATRLPSYHSLKAVATPGTGDALPRYDGVGATQHTKPSVLDHNLPPTFRIDKSYIPALVKSSDLQAHLILLGAFHRLREQVKTQKGQRDFPLTPDEAWAVFLERAVHRLQCWITGVVGDGGDDGGANNATMARSLTPEEFPSIDVMMVWHTYMLSPRTYYEDCLRMHHGLQQIEAFPLLQMCSTIDAETLLPHPATESRSTAFVSSTGEPFDPPFSTTLDDRIGICCPGCSALLSIPWLSADGKGYAQRGFVARCNIDGGCRMEFSRETLAVRKFYEDMERCIKKPEKYFLANTLVDYHTGMPMPDLAKALTSIVLRPNVTSLQKPEVYGKEYGWKLENVEAFLREGFLGKRNKPIHATPKALSLILAPYYNSGPFSMDLASAVLRQMSFIEKMVNLGWTEDGRFEEDGDTLTRCVVRYHAFLDLMASTSGKFIVPTLDIDLVWHTHQLFCSSYRKLHSIMGVVPDHDDKITQGAISTAYDQTAEAWKDRFSVPYSVCGCPPPVKGSSGGTFKSLFSRKGKSKAPPTTINNTRPDLVSVDDINADETHPSDHNSVALMNPKVQNADQAQLRRKELDKRSKELGRTEDGGKEGSDWSGVISKRAMDHSYAFLSPVSYGARDAFGNYGHGDCAVYSGGGVKGEFAAGQCAKGNGHNGICGALFESQRNGLHESVQHAILISGDKTLATEYGVQSAAVQYGMSGYALNPNF